MAINPMVTSVVIIQYLCCKDNIIPEAIVHLKANENEQNTVTQRLESPG